MYIIVSMLLAQVRRLKKKLPNSNLLLLSFQIRRQARLRREYLYRKGVEERQKAIQDKKDRLKKALEGR